MSQKQTYWIWHDAYKTKELSIQTIQNKFVNTFSANTTNITIVDWDEIELTINKLVVETNDTLWMEIFPNHENQIKSSKRNTNFVLDVIKPNFHGMKKMAYLENFKWIQKQITTNFQLIHCNYLKIKFIHIPLFQAWFIH